MTEYDAIIIGAGQAGPSLARRLAAAGNRVAIIERAQFGGTCVNTGCTPTKALVASAYAAHLVRRAAEYGVTIDGAAPSTCTRSRPARIPSSPPAATVVEASLRRTENITVVRGHARFVSANEVTAGGETLRAPRIFINVGARPAIPPISRT